MCGIVGYIGMQANANEVLLNGLKALEYRGYDSAGIASVANHQVTITKAKGNVAQLEAALQQQQASDGMAGIAHTRWATHGKPSVRNAHPHRFGCLTLVHNGIIENYQTLKAELQIDLQSDTDSEVAAALIHTLYQTCKNKQKALTKAYHQLQGSFAFAIIFDDEPDAIYAMRKNSPLVLGVDKQGAYIGSDVSAFLSYTNQYIELDHEEIARLDEHGIIIKNLENEFVKKEIKKTELQISELQKGGYEHFMLKEIHEEPSVIESIIATYLPNDLHDLMQTMPDLSAYEELHIVACGSAMYAGMIAQHLIESKAEIRTYCAVASEYRYAKTIYRPNTLVILISQSGETADTIAALQMAKEHGVKTLAIVNVVGSTIARMADDVLYTNAGPEISVATTKAYCAQVALCSLIAMKLALIHNHLTDEEANEIMEELKLLPNCMKTLIASAQYKEAAKLIYEHEDVYFIGRGLDYALSMEGSLKLKEISYIHSEAYAAGELKHGTISLIQPGTPVIALTTDLSLYDKTISNIKEVKARGANILLLATENMPLHEDLYDDHIIVPLAHPLLQGILTVIPLQLIAYETAKLRGCEIDQPRNLAKSVTVE